MDDKHHATFIAYYETHFGNFPGRGKAIQQGLWWGLVDNIKQECFDRLFDRVKYNKADNRKNPVLEDFKKAWREVSPERRMDLPHKKCGICDNRGIYFAPVYISHNKNSQLVWSLDGTKHILNYYTLPCKCSFGDDIRHKYDIPDDLYDAAFQQERAIHGICNIDDEKPMTLKEYLEAADPEMPTVIEYKHNMVQESLKWDAIRKEHDTAHFEKPIKKVTLEIIKRRQAGQAIVKAEGRKQRKNLEQVSTTFLTTSGDVPW
jgi:hypothetical protein